MYLSEHDPNQTKRSESNPYISNCIQITSFIRTPIDGNYLFVLSGIRIKLKYEFRIRRTIISTKLGLYNVYSMILLRLILLTDSVCITNDQKA